MIRSDSVYHYDAFEIPTRRGTTILDALIYTKQYLMPVYTGYSCRMTSLGRVE